MLNDDDETAVDEQWSRLTVLLFNALARCCAP
jgi:hypothetical protein